MMKVFKGAGDKVSTIKELSDPVEKSQQMQSILALCINSHGIITVLNIFYFYASI